MSERITPVAGNLLTDYQAQAMTTAKLTALNLDYLIPGLISEIGEVFGAQAKAVRDGWPPETLKGEMTKEMGDVAWMIAVALRELGEDTLHARNPAMPGALGQTMPGELSKEYSREVLGGFARAAGKLYGFYWDADHFSLCGELIWLWLFMQRTQHILTGRDFPTVLAYNLDKLRDRSARGVIGGSGDNR